MQIKNWLFSFLVTYSSLSIASLSHLSCSKSGTEIIFVNGINVNLDDYASFRTASNSLIDNRIDKFKVDQKGNVHPNTVYNTGVNQLKDLAETYFLYLKTRGYEQNKIIFYFKLMKLLSYLASTDEGKFNTICAEFDDPDVQNICKELLFLKNNYPQSQTFKDLGALRTLAAQYLNEQKKVIFISHSAGAMFVDRARDYINTYHKEYSSNVGHLALARPLRSKHKYRVEHLNFDRDQLLRYIRSTGGPGTFVPVTVELLDDCMIKDESAKFPTANHPYLCYLSDLPVIGKAFLGSNNTTSEKLVADYIYLIASKLGNNDESCCDKKPGKLWRNDWVCENVPTEPQSCQSSFISEETIKNLNVNNQMTMNNSQICGEYEISSTNVDSYLSSTKLLGRGKIVGDLMFLPLSTFLKGSYIDSDLVSFESYATEWTGTSKLIGKRIKFDASKINGNNQIESFGNHELGIFSSQLNSTSPELNKITSKGLSASGTSTITNSVLAGKFDLTLENSLFRESQLTGTTIVNGQGSFASTTSTGKITLNRSSGYKDGPSLQNVVNTGELTMTNNSYASGVTFSGTNSLMAPPTNNSTIVSAIYGANAKDINLSGKFIVNVSSGKNIEKLNITNYTYNHLLLETNSWTGSLTLNGSMHLVGNEIGNNVTINAIPLGPTNSADLTIYDSVIADGLNITEKGAYGECDFSGSGSSYTKNCTYSDPGDDKYIFRKKNLKNKLLSDSILFKSQREASKKQLQRRYSKQI